MITLGHFFLMFGGIVVDVEYGLINKELVMIDYNSEVITEEEMLLEAENELNELLATLMSSNG